LYNDNTDIILISHILSAEVKKNLAGVGHRPSTEPLYFHNSAAPLPKISTAPSQTYNSSDIMIMPLCLVALLYTSSRRPRVHSTTLHRISLSRLPLKSTCLLMLCQLAIFALDNVLVWPHCYI